MTIRVICVAAAFVALEAPHIATGQQSPSHQGTYALWLCPEACSLADTTRATVVGRLILAERAFASADLPSTTRGVFRQLGIATRADYTANACFVLKKRSTRTGMMAGIHKLRMTNWHHRGDSITVTLYRSPDAWYTLTATIDSAGQLRGKGTEAGYIGRSFHHDAGEAHGVRIGAADLALCVPD